MRIHNWVLSLLFKCAIVAIGVYSLAQQLGVFYGTVRLTFFFYFTNLSNVAVVAYFIGAVIDLIRHHKDSNGPRVWKPMLKYTTMMGVTVTWLIAHFLLGGGSALINGTISFPLLALHYLVPIGAIFDWLLFDKKGSMKYSDPLTWTCLPIIYFAYIMVMVNLLGIKTNALATDSQFGPATSRYPYPFIDVDALGIERVAFTVIILIVGFLALSALFVLVDHILANIGSKHDSSKV